MDFDSAIPRFAFALRYQAMTGDGGLREFRHISKVYALTPVQHLGQPSAVNDPTASNVAQILISGTRRFTPGGMSMPAFGSTYTDTEIAAVANYVIGRFGSAASRLTAKDVADLRSQTAR